MSDIRFIDSVKNSLVREVALIKEKSRWRKKTGLFVAEGQKEVEMALKGGFELDKIFFFEDLLSTDQVKELLKTYGSNAEVIEVSKDVYKRIAYREKTEGIVALGRAKPHRLEDLQFHRSQPLLLVAESLEKPGNLGALLRTADAAHLDGVIISNPKTDLYNPNVIRSSLGCLFSVPVAVADNTQVIAYLKDQGIRILAAELQASRTYSTEDLTPSTAVVVGTEATGLSNEWIEAADSNILIPMQGIIDSMNVSVSAAIIIFEAMRQRNFK